ncbi:PREDICTED: tudor and KH domain-containing protein-like isoform X1 [Papilio xuthus]|uniref:Tudor and KH domain-containing protein-like isoform X1 n=1 Tax=Papilio xuthus TaxID=66420 RepID=A0AAJ7EJZ7_PAPXU|nr:PREDICTED: tudor and KH domain-containing protein-like isoform X1 [Papilio xuthus]XP_013180202.1 PREDICTED: tudor and KH domain-containing protein-like isoform X1 [Papilio xuthus]
MPLNTKLLLPAALALSIVTVTAFVAYYIFKKDEEETSEKTVKAPKLNTIEVSVPKSIVPALIGRNGSNIKDIESKSGAMIHFKKFSDKEYDVCIIRGRSQATQIADAIIQDFIKQQPVIETDTMLVPGWACGRIIGTGGENINNISHRSGARVKIEGSPSAESSTQRQITFRGTKEQIRVAMDLIENYVAQEKCRREIEQSKRTPRVTIPPPSVPQPQETPGRPALRHVKCKPDPNKLENQEAVNGNNVFPVDINLFEEASSSSIEVYVSAVSSPSRFWVQFVGPQVAQLDNLVAHMTEYYSNKENRAAHALETVSVGQVVAAVFRHDGRWYRARVHDIRPNEFDATHQVADVFFLDYGDSEYVATHELCELRADLLRLRFQAMECFLAGVKPSGGARWHSQAIERFEELTQVARWKPLLSKTCTYKKSVAMVGEKEKEIPGIKLFDVTEEGTVEVGEALVEEGWAERSASPRPSPPPARATPNSPFGDLGNSRVLGMLPSTRSSSLPKDHKDDRSEDHTPELVKDLTPISPSKSLSSGLETSDKLKSVSNFDLSYSEFGKPSQNGSNEDFINKERSNIETDISSVPSTPSFKTRDEFKANMNRIDSHHSNLETLGRSQH